MSAPVTIRAAAETDAAVIANELVRNWGSTEIWSLGRMFRADRLPAAVAELDGAFAGLVTWHIDGGDWQGEVVTISSRIEDRGVGTALLDAAVAAIRAAGCRRAFLTT